MEYDGKCRVHFNEKKIEAEKTWFINTSVGSNSNILFMFENPHTRPLMVDLSFPWVSLLSDVNMLSNPENQRSTIYMMINIIKNLFFKLMVGCLVEEILQTA